MEKKDFARSTQLMLRVTAVMYLLATKKHGMHKYAMQTLVRIAYRQDVSTGCDANGNASKLEVYQVGCFRRVASVSIIWAATSSVAL